MSNEDGLKIVTMNIDGMHCERCVKSVQDGLLSLEGVGSVNVGVGKAEVQFLPQLTSEADIEQAIVDAGYAVRKQAPRKRFFGRYIDRMIESNQNNFGSERLDCCNLSSKQR